MLRHVSLVVASLSLFACGTGSTSSTGTGTSPTEPAGKDGGSSSKDDGGSSNGGADLGPSCTAYVACCEELAKSQPQLAASCDAVQKQIDTAQANGVSTETYESACKSGVTSFQSAGYCK
jgi:hypothetical protein